MKKNKGKTDGLKMRLAADRVLSGKAPDQYVRYFRKEAQGMESHIEAEVKKFDDFVDKKRKEYRWSRALVYSAVGLLIISTAILFYVILQ